MTRFYSIAKQHQTVLPAASASWFTRIAIQSQSKDLSIVAHDLPIGTRLKLDRSTGISVTQLAVATLRPKAAPSLRSHPLMASESDSILLDDDE